jgi:hypothetical protein
VVTPFAAALCRARATHADTLTFARRSQYYNAYGYPQAYAQPPGYGAFQQAYGGYGAAYGQPQAYQQPQQQRFPSAGAPGQQAGQSQIRPTGQTAQAGQQQPQQAQQQAYGYQQPAYNQQAYNAYYGQQSAPQPETRKEQPYGSSKDLTAGW